MKSVAVRRYADAQGTLFSSFDVGAHGVRRGLGSLHILRLPYRCTVPYYSLTQYLQKIGRNSLNFTAISRIGFATENVCSHSLPRCLLPTELSFFFSLCPFLPAQITDREFRIYLHFFPRDLAGSAQSDGTELDPFCRAFCICFSCSVFTLIYL